MEPFRLVCPLCASKVVVRHAQMIGQTLPCPKCQGPIKVEAPNPAQSVASPAHPDAGTSGPNEPRLTDSTPSATGPSPNKPTPPTTNKPTPSKAPRTSPVNHPSTINSGAITKIDPADWDIAQIEAGLAAPKNPSSPLASPLPDFSDVDSIALEHAFAAQSLESELQKHPTAEPVAESLPSEPLTAIKLRKQQAQSQRQLILLGTVGITGALLAFLLFLAFVQYFGKNKEKGVAANNPNIAGNENIGGNNSVSNSNVGSDPVQGPDADKTNATNPPIGPNGVAANAAGNDPDARNNRSDDIDPASNDGKLPNAPLEQAPLNAANAPNVAEPKIQPGIASPELGPLMEPAAVGPGKQNGQAESLAVDEAPIDEKMPSVFREFQQMFNRSSQATWDDVGRSGRTIDSELSLENTEVLFKEEYYPPAVPLPRWEERSQRILNSVRTKPMNLVRATDWLNKSGGVGITLDWFQINLSDIDLDAPITIEGENITLGAILEKICTEKGLEAVVYSEGFVYLRPLPGKWQGRLRIDGSTDAGPLSTGLPEGHAQAIVDMLIQLWGIDGCSYADGKLLWSETTEPYVQAQLLGSLQSIREAISGQSAKFRETNDRFDFARPASWIECKKRVQMLIPNDTIVYEERPSMDLLSRSAEASGARLLIDWPAVWGHGFHPGRLSLSVLRGRTLEEVANRYMEDYSLELVPMDSQSVLLTTDAERRSTTRIIALRIDRGIGLAEIKQALRPLVPRGPDQRSRFRCVPLPGDENIVLVRVCPPTLAQLRDNDLVRALGIDRNDR